MADDKYLSQFLDGAAIEAAINKSNSHAANHHNGGIDAIKLDDFATPDDNTDLNASTTRHGLCPKLPGGTTTFLRGDGVFGTAVNPSLEAQVATLLTDVNTLKNQDTCNLTHSGIEIDRLLSIVEYFESYMPVGFMKDMTSTDPSVTRIDVNGDKLNLRSSFWDKHILWGGMWCCVRDRTTGIISPGTNARGDGLTLDGTAGDVLVRIPTARAHFEIEGDFWKWTLSPTLSNDTRYDMHPSAVMRGGVAKPFIYVSAYEAYGYLDGSTFKLGSATGKAPVRGGVSYTGLPNDHLSIAEAETYANNIGAGCGCLNFWTNNYIQMLMTMECGTLDVPSVLGRGITNTANTAPLNTGADSIDTRLAVNGTGVGSGLDGFTPICYRNIRNPYGNLWKYLIGFNADNTGGYNILRRDGRGTVAATLASGSYESGTGLPLTDGYISAIQSNALGALALIPSAVAGDQGKYFCDNYNAPDTTGTKIARVSGRWNGGVSTGPYNLDLQAGITSSDANSGVRFELIPQ